MRQSITKGKAPEPAKPLAHAASHPDTMPDFYILKVEGDCLKPTIHDGSPMMIDKHAKFAAGDMVVLFFKPEFVPAGQHQAILKRLVMNVPPYVKFPWKEHPQSEAHALVVVEMFNPPRKFAYKCEHLLGIHKCLGPVPADATYDPKSKSWHIPSLAAPSTKPAARPQTGRKAVPA